MFKRIFKDVQKIRITEDKYQGLLDAKTTLISIKTIEEIYEILISNYLEFEQETLKLTVSNMISYNDVYEVGFDTRILLSRRLINILTAAKLYLDSLATHASQCSRLDETKDYVKQLKSKEYDKNRSYRFMETYRNYVQHKGLPIDLVQQYSGWKETEYEVGMEYKINFSIRKENLLNAREIKKEVLIEMEEQIDLKLCIRSYLESISCIHDEIRKMLEEDVNISREELTTAIESFNSNFRTKTDSFDIISIDNGEVLSSTAILLNWDEFRIKLQHKNRKLTKLSKRYATGQSTPPK